MANQTVYPYGTGGQLPSNIGIVNDYYTGGANNGFSAEKGKDLNLRLSRKDSLLNAWDLYSGYVAATTFIKDSYTRRFGAISVSGYNAIEITMPSGVSGQCAFVKSFNPSFTNGSSIDFCSGQSILTLSGGEIKMYQVPSDCTHLLVDLESRGTSNTPETIFAYTEKRFGDIHNERVLLATNVVFGTYNTVTGAFSSNVNRRSTGLIDVSSFGRVGTNILSDGYASPYWFDGNGTYLGRSRINSSDSYVEFDIPTGAEKVAFLLAASASVDASGMRVFGITVQDDVEANNDCLEVYLSQFWNGSQTDDQNIADMMDFVSTAAKKIVHFDRDVTISSVILLENNTTVYIDGITIKQADEMFDNVFRSANIDLSGYSDYITMPSSIDEMENIRIVGRGNARIVGPDVNKRDENDVEMVGDGYGNRTWQVCLIRVNGGEISGIAFTKTRGWTIEMELCTKIELHNLYFVTTVKNGDGIDFRVGCKHCIVHDIYGFTEDDLIACTALGDLSYTDAGQTYTGVVSWKIWNELVSQDSTALYIEDVSVKNVTFLSYGTQGHGMICLSAYGSKVRNISIVGFCEVGGGDIKESLIKLYYGYGSGYSTGDIDNIRLDNIISASANYTLQLYGGIITNVWANKLKNDKTAANILTQSSGNNAKVTNS